MHMEELPRDQASHAVAMVTNAVIQPLGGRLAEWSCLGDDRHVGYTGSK